MSLGGDMGRGAEGESGSSARARTQACALSPMRLSSGVSRPMIKSRAERDESQPSVRPLHRAAELRRVEAHDEFPRRARRVAAKLLAPGGKMGRNAGNVREGDFFAGSLPGRARTPQQAPVVPSRRRLRSHRSGHAPSRSAFGRNGGPGEAAARTSRAWTRAISTSIS
eukprot:155426-Chlamydomonas_euryale.AAC.1